jgi:hypothetical protein
MSFVYVSEKKEQVYERGWPLQMVLCASVTKETDLPISLIYLITLYQLRSSVPSNEKLTMCDELKKCRKKRSYCASSHFSVIQLVD